MTDFATVAAIAVGVGGALHLLLAAIRDLPDRRGHTWRGDDGD